MSDGFRSATTLPLYAPEFSRHKPERSGLPSAVRGAGADRSGVPSAFPRNAFGRLFQPLRVGGCREKRNSENDECALHRSSPCAAQILPRLFLGIQKYLHIRATVRRYCAQFAAGSGGMCSAHPSGYNEPMPGSDRVIPATARVKLTYDDFVQFPDDGKRHELIDGEHYVTPSPNTKHQAIS